METMTVLLRVENLSVEYHTDEGVVHALDGVSIEVREGEVLSIVGESGSGKSTLAHAIMRLLPSYARITGGSILFRDTDLLRVPEEDMRRIRGGRIAMIFQEPSTALNPVFKIGTFMADVYQAHNPGSSRKEALEKAVEMLRAVRIPSPGEVLEKYPHELSGGMKQRVLIATALMNNPELLIADEPTSALDVSVQAQILALLKRLQRETGMSVIFITHNLAVAAQVSDRIAVLYAGDLVELGDVEEVFTNPLHPYTKMLLKAVPAIGSKHLEALPGTLPDLREKIRYCKFASRCKFAGDRCWREKPPLFRIGERRVACWLYGGEG